MMRQRSSFSDDNIGVLAYGSLLTDPGDTIKSHIIASIKQETPWPVEYARVSRNRGRAPTLVKVAAGARVLGRILVLDLRAGDIEKVREWLWDREGRPDQSAI